MLNTEKNLTIGQVAKVARVNIQTLRYYERVGILKPVSRRQSGYRMYDGSAIQTLRFIKNAQELGFSLDEIQGLLSLKADRKSKCDNVLKRATDHLKGVETKIERLQRIETTLRDLISQCRQRKTDAECPILSCLDQCDKKEG